MKKFLQKSYPSAKTFLPPKKKIMKIRKLALTLGIEPTEKTLPQLRRNIASVMVGHMADHAGLQDEVESLLAVLRDEDLIRSK